MYNIESTIKDDIITIKIILNKQILSTLVKEVEKIEILKTFEKKNKISPYGQYFIKGVLFNEVENIIIQERNTKIHSIEDSQYSDIYSKLNNKIFINGFMTDDYFNLEMIIEEYNSKNKRKLINCSVNNYLEGKMYCG